MPSSSAYLALSRSYVYQLSAAAEQKLLLAWPEAALLPKGGEMAREMAAAANTGRHEGSGWRSCSSTPRGSRFDHLAQQALHLHALGNPANYEARGIGQVLVGMLTTARQPPWRHNPVP
jgi:hypothetical protein